MTRSLNASIRRLLHSQPITVVPVPRHVSIFFLYFLFEVRPNESLILVFISRIYIS